jgi:hypothetical protein
MNSNQRIIFVVLVVVLIGAGATTALYLLSPGKPPTTQTLPPGCVKPPGGFLIIASNLGYNDSITHGAPTKSWPIITVKQGQTVNITICNIDVQAHGFQITHYYDSSVVTVVPGQVLQIKPFVADQTGSFSIYCDIFCSIHPYMQSGLLDVTSS